MYLCIVIAREKSYRENRGRFAKDRHGISSNFKVKPLNKKVYDEKIIDIVCVDIGFHVVTRTADQGVWNSLR